MRQIKFRAKDKFTGLWVYGFPRKTALGNWFIYDNLNRYCIDPDTLGQCTGISDIHSKAIYEGDIIQIYWGDDYDDKSLKGEVRWDNAELKILIHGKKMDYFNSFDNDPLISYEIIGNIHTQK